MNVQLHSTQALQEVPWFAERAELSFRRLAGDKGGPSADEDLPVDEDPSADKDVGVEAGLGILFSKMKLTDISSLAIISVGRAFLLKGLHQQPRSQE